MRSSEELMDRAAELMRQAVDRAASESGDEKGEDEQVDLFGTTLDLANRLGILEGKVNDMPTKSWVWRLVAWISLGLLTLWVGILTVIGSWLRVIMAIWQEAGG